MCIFLGLKKKINKSLQFDEREEASELLYRILDGDISEIEDMSDDDNLNELDDINEVQPNLLGRNLIRGHDAVNGDDEKDENDGPGGNLIRGQDAVNGEEEEDDVPGIVLPKRRKPPNMKWKFMEYHPPTDISWKGLVFQDNGEDIGTPLSYFKKYIPDTIFQMMTDETNLYSVKTTGKSINTNIFEIKKFVSQHIIMGILKFPRLRMYWNPTLRIPAVADHMSRNRFESLRNNLHLVNEKPPATNSRLWKVQPIISAVLERCKNLSLEENLCIDEQIIPFKGTLKFKQYIKGKPTPWGIKVYLLCGASGLVHNAIIYEGKSTPLKEDLTKLYGIAGAVVIQLCEIIPSGQNYKLFADNFFTSVQIIKGLKEKQIFYAGTVRKNRLPGYSFQLKKRAERGTIKEAVSGDGEIVIIEWMDNNVVTMASSFVGKGSIDRVERWSKKEKRIVSIDRPEIVNLYNQCMGGVDKTDFLLQLYRIFIRSRKWTLRVIFHFISVAITNSWLEYRKESKVKKIPERAQMDLLEFSFTIAEALAKQGIAPNKRGRPSSSSPLSNVPKKKLCPMKRPITDVRYDNVGHWPQMTEKPGRCKLEICHSRSRVQCQKCMVHLCLSSKQNCFYMFHVKN